MARREGKRPPAGTRARRLLLWCAATDSSFERAEVGGATVLSGKCIHCGTRHVIGLDGRPRTRASVEHIIPRNHGGTDALVNLAIACERCNYAKGVRLDPRQWADPTLQKVVATLQARRAARMRPAPEWLELPPLPDAGDPDDA